MTWYKNSGKDSDIVFSTKIRLSRNLENYPFPARLSSTEKHQLATLIRDALNADGSLSFIDMEKLSKYETVSLAEKNLISPEFASNSSGRALLLSPEEDVSIMLFEEDHVKIQSLLPGLSPKQAYEAALKYDSLLENAFQIAFDEKLGYLTPSPVNIGTGLRASVTLHLYALNSSGEMHKLASTVSKLGMTLRPSYTERGKVIGDIFTLSNQVTLGISEDAALTNLELIAGQLISQEREARSRIIEEPATLDNIFRSYGILLNAYLLSATELINLLSPVRFGAGEGKLDLKPEELTRIFVELQSATLSASKGENISVTEREKLRAEEARKAMKS